MRTKQQQAGVTVKEADELVLKALGDGCFTWDHLYRELAERMNHYMIESTVGRLEHGGLVTINSTPHGDRIETSEV